MYPSWGEASPREVFGNWGHVESFLPAFNCSGQPAISLPLHQAESGLPIGMQLVGRLGDEATLFRVAAQLEEALPWRDRLPRAARQPLAPGIIPITSISIIIPARCRPGRAARCRSWPGPDR